MTKNVLVLCQRKIGLDYSNVNVAVSVIPKINEYVTSLLGSDTKIEYLTDCSGFTCEEDSVDYKFNLDSDPTNSEAVEFISTHKEYYSLIILNTCPFPFMDYNAIYELLEPRGIMVMKRYPSEFKKGDRSTLSFLKASELAYFKTLFDNTPYPEYDTNNEFVYVKIEQTAGRPPRVTRRTKTRRTRTRRNIKKSIRKRKI